MPAGMIARVTPLPASVSIDRCTMPSPPQTNTSSAPSSSARWTRSGAYLLFGTSDQIGSSMPCLARTERNSSSPPPIVLPAWAITATFFMPSLPSSRADGCLGGVTLCCCRTCGPGREDRDAEGGDAHQDADRDIGDVVHAAQHARPGHEHRDRDDERPEDDPDCAILDSRGEDDQQATEQRDRGCRVPGGVAGVDREALEPLHVGPVAMDDKARSSIGARLDADHEQRERREAPVLRDEEHDQQDPDESRDHEPAREGRADPREIDRGARPLADDGAADALVPGGDAVDLQEHPGEEEADGDRQRKQDRVAAENGCEKDANGMTRADRGGEPLCRTAGRRLEERRPRAVAAIFDRASGRPGGRRLRRA